MKTSLVEVRIMNSEMSFHLNNDWDLLHERILISETI